MENSLKSLVDSTNSILILLPRSPYFDQVAAGLSLYLVLKDKKSTSVYSPSPMTVEFNRLVGVDKVTSEFGGKNLVIKFKDYNAQDIERVTYDIESQEFKLSVVPKPQANPPEKEQIVLEYSGVASETVIMVGGANDSHFPSLTATELANAKLAHIGTHTLSLTNGKNVISFSKQAASVCEVVAQYVRELEGKFTMDVASNLLAGLFEGTKNFSTQYVTASTFKLAFELMEAGGKYKGRDSRSRDYTPQDFGVNQKVKEDKLEPQKAEGPAPETISDEEAPKSWLEPKIYKGTSVR